MYTGSSGITTKSDHPEIVSVSSLKLIAKKPGSCTITFQNKYGSKVSMKCTVKASSVERIVSSISCVKGSKTRHLPCHQCLWAAKIYRNFQQSFCSKGFKRKRHLLYPCPKKRFLQPNCKMRLEKIFHPRAGKRRHRQTCEKDFH